MESNVELALAAKMLKLFPPGEETYLAFPLAGAAFTSGELAIFERPGESAADIRLRSHHKAQFARLMNQVPVESLRWNASDRGLGTEYKRVLDEAEMAGSALTAAERAKLAAARRYLSKTVRTEDGETTVYSAAVTSYYQYKEAAEELERTYLDEKLTAELSQDPAVKAEWEGGRRETLEAARAKAAQDWAVLGHKAEVEAAQATVAALGAKDPQVRRVALLAEYDSCLEPDVESGDAVGVPSTFYSPSDVFSPTATWNTLHLTGDEVSSLLAEAPTELAELKTSGGGGIDSVTVEYTSVTVMRPWFDPAFLAMRSWRLPDDGVVSDGATPRAGRIPGYVTSLVVARKVTIARTVPADRPNEPSRAGSPPALKGLGYLAKALRGVEQQWRVQPVTGPVRDVTVPARIAGLAPTEAEHRASAPAVSDLRNAVVTAKSQGMTVTRLPAVVAPRSLMSTEAEPAAIRDAAARLRDLDVDGSAPSPRRPPAVPGRPLPPPPGLPSGPPPSPPPGAPGGAPATTTQVVDEVTLDGVVVLAYRIRRVPKSPNPDPGLDWEGAVTPVEPLDTATSSTVKRKRRRRKTTADTSTTTVTPPEPSVPVADDRPYPLPEGHCYGRRAGSKVHDGTASAADRVGVLAVQTRLRELGRSVVVDGVVGQKTDRAIRAFQRANRLHVDGLVGATTWKALWA